ncbi:type III PLP-dependent enzyme [Bacillus massilinigeriensis]|uniref:type III PLP-dependent enzyme n=1 Tax=Bacillus mediterraneensis TaxID=1805474 RepID=UPI0008F8DA4E|nr:type III PLP-dependent enzyme [Bacillus mediterraneensis]
MEKTIQKLKQQSDKPFCAYCYDLEELRRHTGKLVDGLPGSCSLFYAIKANPDRIILKELLPIVHGFEAASLGEIEKIRSVDANVPILFGGPGKTRDELEGALKLDVALFHAESFQELRLLQYVAEKEGRNAEVMLRVNLENAVPDAELKMAGVPTQFGIEEKQIPKAIEFVERLPNLQLQGFHFHAMSNNLDAAAHAEFVANCFELGKNWAKEWNLHISYLNVGGGIGISYVDADRQFDWEVFMELLEKVLERNKETGWKVIFECGRYLTASCGYYAAEILDIKENHGKHFCILRGGSHHLRLPAAWKHNHPFTIVSVEDWEYPFERPEIKNKSVVLAGELCTPNDILARDVHVTRLRAGDILLFHYAGAYGWTISHHDFLSHPHPEFVYLASSSGLIVEEEKRLAKI